MSEINRADFTPDAPNFKTLVRMSFQGLTNFPYIEEDFDALTNYGLLSKVVEYLNEVISNNNEQNDLMTGLYNAYVSLQNYVNDYFDNLDVQEEINNKLDAMAQDGSLTLLISNYLNPYIDAINDDLNNQNERIDFIETKVDSAVSGSPHGVYQTLSDLQTDNPNHAYIYVVLSNGHWYYWNEEWLDGGVYQASVNTLDIENLQINSNNYGKYLSILLKNERGGFSETDITTTDTRTDRFRSPILNLTEPVLLTLSDNLLFAVYKHNITTSESSLEKSYCTEYYLIPEEGYQYRLLLRNSEHTSLVDTPLDYTHVNDLNKNIADSVNVIDGFNYNNLLIGSFNGQNDIRLDTTVNNRICSLPFVLKTKTRIKCNNNNYQMLYYKMNIETMEISSVGYKDERVIEKEDNMLYRLLFKKLDNSTITQTELNNIKDSLVTFEKVFDVKIPEAFTQNYKNLIRANTDVSLINRNQLKQTFKEFPNGFVCIGFDDGNYDVNAAIEYCHSKNYPCYYALIPKKTTDTNVDRMIRNLLTYGGEICSHNLTVITPQVQSNNETMFDLFINTRFELETKYNTKVHGIIKAGGTGQDTEDKAIDEQWAKIAGYEYSDYYGVNTPYTLTRKNLTRFTHEEQYTELLKVVNNKEFQIWFCHHVNGEEKNSYPNGYTLDDFKYFVDTCVDLNIAVVTPYYVISNYLTTELEERVKALEDSLS